MGRPPVVERAALRKSYFRRHWSGELALPVSYWVNVLLLSLIVHIAFRSIPHDIDVTSAPRLASGGIVAIWILLAAITVWQFVGAWRSARRHKDRGGSRFWARAARVAIAIGVISSASSLLKAGLPQSIEYAKIAAGSDPYAQATLDISTDGRTLFLSGGIGFGLADRVTALLERNPHVAELDLSSVGGRVQEARRLARVVRARALSTAVTTGCFSACTLVFAAGEERSIARNGRLGFHRYAFPGVKDREFVPTELLDRRFLADRGIAGDFISRVYATPNSELWQPTHAELFKARVVTAYMQVADEEVRFAKTFLDQPLYRTIHEFEREEYDAMMKSVIELVRQGRAAESRTIVMSTIVPLYKRYMPHASDDAVRAMIKVTIDQARLLKSRDPELCFSYFNPERGAPAGDVSQHFTQDLADREFKAMENVIRSAVTAPRAVPEGPQIQADMATISDAAARRLGPRRALTVSDAAPENRVAHCEMTIFLLEEMSDLPAARGPTLMRALIAASR